MANLTASNVPDGTNEVTVRVTNRITRQKPPIPDKVSIVFSTGDGLSVAIELESDEAVQLSESLDAAAKNARLRVEK